MKLERGLNFITIIGTLIGIIDSTYLTWVKFSHNEAFCLPGIGNCETVNTSRYAVIGNIPVALIGLVGYLLILILLLVENRALFGIAAWKDYCKMGEFGLALIGVLFSVYLTYLEVAVIHAICPFCVLSAVMMLVIFATSLTRLALSQADTQS